MKYYGKIEDNKDLVTKEWVEEHGGSGGANPIIDDTNPVKHLSDLTTIGIGYKEGNIDGLSWDGDITGKTVVPLGEGFNFYKMAGKLKSADASYLIDTELSFTVDGDVYTQTIKTQEEATEADAVYYDGGTVFEGFYINTGFGSIVYVHNNNTVFAEMTFPEAGIYFPKYDDGEMVAFVSYLDIKDISYHKIGAQYLPDINPQVVDKTLNEYSFEEYEELSTNANTVLYSPWSSITDNSIYYWNGDTTLPSLVIDGTTFYRVSNSIDIKTLNSGYTTSTLGTFTNDRNSALYGDNYTCLAVYQYGSGSYGIYNAISDTYISRIQQTVSEGLWIFNNTSLDLKLIVPQIHKMSTLYIDGFANEFIPGLVKTKYTSSSDNLSEIVIDDNGEIWSNISVSDTGSATDTISYITINGTEKKIGGSSYNLPIASASTLGGIKVGTNLSINSSTGVLSATDTTYSDVTTSTHGLMTAADKTKLNGIAAGANNYSLPTASSSTLGGVKIGSNISISSGVISVPAAGFGTAGVINLGSGFKILSSGRTETLNFVSSGTYSGNGSSNRSISLGSAASMVILSLAGDMTSVTGIKGPNLLIIKDQGAWPMSETGTYHSVDYNLSISGYSLVIPTANYWNKSGCNYAWVAFGGY